MCRLVKWNSFFVLKLKNVVFRVMLLDLVCKSEQADRREFVASFAVICKTSTIFNVAHKFYDLATKTSFWTWMYLMTWALMRCFVHNFHFVSFIIIKWNNKLYIICIRNIQNVSTTWVELIKKLAISEINKILLIYLSLLS